MSLSHRCCFLSGGGPDDTCAVLSEDNVVEASVEEDILHVAVLSHTEFKGDEAALSDVFPPDRCNGAVETETVAASEEGKSRLAGDFLFEFAHILSGQVRGIGDDYISLRKSLRGAAFQDVSFVYMYAGAVQLLVLSEVTERFVRDLDRVNLR